MRHIYADFIDSVAKPARYLGGEYQSITKDPADVDARIVLAFPDLYDIGMSHLGTRIIYSLLNKNPKIACERAVHAVGGTWSGSFGRGTCRWSPSNRATHCRRST